jgi:ubiquinone/menaquinone biosynthesis C-methylase UbiE
VEEFLSGNEFVSVLKEAGFKAVQWKPLTFGIVSVYIAEK